MLGLRFSLIGLCLTVIVAAQNTWAGELVVSSAFEGGSADVLEIDQAKRSIQIRPAGKPQFGWPCWWYFQVSGVEPGEEITVTVDASQMQQANGQKLSSNWALPERAAFSTDQKIWRQTAVGSKGDGTRQWKTKVDAEQAWFAWGPPFVPADAKHLVERLGREHADVTAFELCKTRAGRAVPALVVSQDEGETDSRMLIWVQARQHAWESGGSWVGRGFIEWAVSDDPPGGGLEKESRHLFCPDYGR